MLIKGTQRVEDAQREPGEHAAEARKGRLRLGRVLGAASRSQPVSAVASRTTRRRRLTMFTQVRRRLPGL